MDNITWERYEDNAGWLHLAALDNTGRCVWYYVDGDRQRMAETVAAAMAGEDPIRDGWESGEPDPAACYGDIREWVEARNGGAWEI